MVKNFSVALLLAFTFVATHAKADTNPLNLPHNCYKNDECVIKALERSGRNEVDSELGPLNGIKYIDEAEYWKIQRDHMTKLWRSAVRICPTLNGGHYPSVPYTDMLIVGCKEAEFSQ